MLLRLLDDELGFGDSALGAVAFDADVGENSRLADDIHASQDIPADEVALLLVRQDREAGQRMQAVLVDEIVEIAFLRIIPADELQSLATAIDDSLVSEFGVGD